MSQQNTPTEPVTPPVVVPPVTPPAAVPPVVTPPATTEELSPEVLRRELTKANAEAAAARVQLREMNEKLASAKTPEEFATVQAENEKLREEGMRRDIATEHKLPAELAATILALPAGMTKEQVETHVKAIAKHVPSPDTAPPAGLSGGLDPSSQADPDEKLTPAELARKYGTRRKV